MGDTTHLSEFEIKFNPDKCYLLIFADNSIHEFENIIVKICGERVKVVEKEVHLGHVITTNRNLVDVGPIITDVKVRTNTTVNNFNYVSNMSKVRLFTS